MSKTAPASASAGSDITYVVTLGNNGPNSASSVTLSDVLPAGVTFVSYTQPTGPTFTCSTPAVGSNGTINCSIATLANGATAQFDIVVHLDTGLQAGTVVSNTAVVATSSSDTNSGNDQSTATTTISEQADLFVTKTAPATASVGSNITFVVLIGNNGPNDAVSATLNDVLPANATFVSYTQPTGPTFICTTPSVGSSGTVACSRAVFANGATAEFDIVANVTANAAGTTLINTATISSQTADDNGENNTSISGTSVPGGNLADVSIVKTGPSAAPPNTDVTFTITLVNNGQNDATTVSFTDTLPNSVPPASGAMTFVSFTQNSGPTFNCGSPGTTTTCSIAVFPNGSTATFTLVGHIPSSATAGTDYTNQATLTSDNDPNPDNNTSAATVTVSSVDVSVTKSAPPTAIAGGPTFDYVVTLANGGPDTATDVSFNDALPAGIDFVSITQDTGPTATCGTPTPNTNGPVACTIALLGNGASAQFTITVRAEPTVADGTVASNTATATTSSFDRDASNNSSTAATTISAQADMAIVKSGPATANAGADITYTITVTNNGPSNAANVSWTDTLPAGTTFVSESQTTGPTFTCTTGATISCSIASLGPGATATFSVTAHVSPGAASGSTLSNTANVSTTTADTNSNNNSSNVTTTVATSADVSVVKTAPAVALAGSNVTYTITVANAGPSDAQSVTLTDVLPAGTTFVSESQVSGPTFTCTTGATISCSIGTLAAGATAVFNVTVTINGNVANGTTLTNTANVATATSDPNANNNSSSAPTLVSANADLSVTKSGPPSTPTNTTVTYTVVAANAGPSTAVNVSLSETVPTGMTFVSVNQTTGPAFACSGTGPIVCTIASFAPGASATFQFTFNVPLSTASGTTSTDTATISSTTPDPNPTNNTASATTTIGQSIPALSPLAMLLMAMVLAAVGWVAMRR